MSNINQKTEFMTNPVVTGNSVMMLVSSRNLEREREDQKMDIRNK
jgi:hypothetical protein